jgi:hypothetical protein
MKKTLKNLRDITFRRATRSTGRGRNAMRAISRLSTGTEIYETPRLKMHCAIKPLGMPTTREIITL